MDNEGNAYQFSGGKWVGPQAAGFEGAGQAVSCPSVNFCMGVDGVGDIATWTR